MASEPLDRVFEDSPVPEYPAFEAIQVGVDDGIAVYRYRLQRAPRPAGPLPSATW